MVGSYTNASGETKNRYQNIGAVMEKDDGGRFILLERWFNPAGVPHDAERGNSILVSMFEPKPRDGQGQQQEQPRRQSPFSQEGKQGPAAKPAEEFQDDIPF